MSDSESTRVNLSTLRSAIGITLPNYSVASIDQLVARVVARLEQMIASGAPDSETGDVVDPLIDAWIAEQQALLREARVDHLRSWDELMIRAEAFVTMAEERLTSVTEQAKEARDYLGRIDAALGAQPSRHTGEF